MRQNIAIEHGLAYQAIDTGKIDVTGLALNDTDLILQGAVPAALLAIPTELAFSGLERVLIPAHLRAH